MTDTQHAPTRPAPKVTLETDCPYCGRAVGVISRLNIGERAYSGYKLPVHSAGAPGVGQRRPRCQSGSGLEVDRSALREVSISAATRKQQQERAVRAARQAAS